METIHIQVSSVLKVPEAEIPPALLEQIKKRLTFRNPLFGRSSRFGKRLDPEKVPETLLAFWPSTPAGAEEPTLVLPKGYLHELVRLCHAHRILPAVADLTPVLPPPFQTALGVERAGLTYEQALVVDDMAKQRFGILTGPPGAGKRICAVKLALRQQFPMLVIVSTRADLYQWRELMAHKDNGIDPSLVGLLGDGHLDEARPVTVAIGPSLRNYWDIVPKETGLLVIDRVDYVSWSVIWKTRHINSRAQWGLATGARGDGLTRLMEVYIGPRSVALEAFQAAPGLRVTATEFDAQGEYEDVMKALQADPARNSAIAADILQAAAADLRCVVLSDRILHLSDIGSRVAEALGPEFRILHSTVKEADLALAVDRFNRGKLRILAVPIKSVPLLDPVKTVDRLFITAPVKTTDYLMRLIARMGEDGMIHEYRDRTPLLKWSLGRRVRVYRRMGIR